MTDQTVVMLSGSINSGESFDSSPPDPSRYDTCTQWAPWRLSRVTWHGEAEQEYSVAALDGAVTVTVALVAPKHHQG